MNPKTIFLLGSTGSIGTQTLEIVRANPNKFNVFGLTANTNARLLANQIREFKPKVAVLADTTQEQILRNLVGETETTLFFGISSVRELIQDSSYDIVLNSLVGFSGFIPTVEALKAGKTVALANKESLVVGGELLKSHLSGTTKKLLPVDSEHSALLQCLIGEEQNEIEKMLITASGGPFRTYTKQQMSEITVEQALNHPNWSMGSKITIDSATMMNKGLEIIEAYWLFDLPLEKIVPVIHPQSIIHSMVTFTDGSTKAQMGYPDMKVPIQYALTWPNRLPLETPRMDFNKLRELTFEPVDFERFPCLKLAMDAISEGGYAPAVLNASNEVAVERFLAGEIPYITISEIVEKSLENIHCSEILSVETLTQIDNDAREFAGNLRI